MQYIHCRLYQGSIAAVHVEFPAQELYGSCESEPETKVISPVTINQLGDVTFLPAVNSVDEAIAAAEAQIERDNRYYVEHVVETGVPAQNAIQHFQDCGISSESIQSSIRKHPYSSRCLLSYLCNNCSPVFSYLPCFTPFPL